MREFIRQCLVPAGRELRHSGVRAKAGVVELGVGEGRDDVVQVLDDRGRAVPQVPPAEAVLENFRLPFVDFGLDGALCLLKPG